MAPKRALVQGQPETERKKAVRIEGNLHILQPSLPLATHPAPQRLHTYIQLRRAFVMRFSNRRACY